jgi:hypothetical protein
MGRSLRLALLGAWIGAIVFFAIAVAPNVFSVLWQVPAGRTLAGDIVQRALLALHVFGLSCGVLFLLLGWRGFNRIARLFVLGMMLLTCVSQFVITPRMQQMRMNASHAAASVSDEDLQRFNRLHQMSTSTEAAILLLGIAALIFESRRQADSR